MRNVVVAGRVLLFVASLVALPFIGAYPAAAADARIIISPDGDYPGFDIETVKGVDLNACKAACLANDQCRAFTFNGKAGWCFLKSDFGVLTATPGATAGRRVETVELTPSLERQRLGELDFIPGNFIDEARELAGAIKRRYDPANGSYVALRDSAGAAYRAANYDQAAIDFGEALAVADDNPGLWLDFAIANLGRNPEGWSDKQTAYTNVTAGAINAYVRSEDVDNRAAALALVGDGFRLREIWKPSYRAYRASLALRDDADVRATYEKVIAEHGFRIVSHEVDADSADPSMCIVFSDSLPVARPGLADYVVVEGGEGVAIEPAEKQICVDGLKHGGRYHVRVRGGLPAADGESLAHPTELDIYVRDRAPWVGFTGNSYVLPAGEGASIPLVSINTSKAFASIYRVNDRGLAYAIRNDQFLRQLAPYSASTIADESGEKVFEGVIEIASKLNETITTAVPIAKAVPALKPGVYVLTAKAELSTDEWGALATQWFVVSDLGLTTLSGNDGLHAIVRSLATAKPVVGVKLRLVATNNDLLGEATTDADGYARFEPGLARGTGGAAPRLIDATTASGDYAFLDLSRPAFDLSDRGVEGRTAPGPLDVFMTPERGIYRPGETVHLTALVRDARANAVGDLPLTLKVDRPDGVEFLSRTLSDGGLGGYSADVALEPNAMRGSWIAKLYADPEGDAIAETSLLVEDFQPERLAFELTTDAKSIGATEPATVELTAKYLYGATAPGLSIDGDIDLKPVTALAAFPGFRFGLDEESIEPVRQPIDIGETTDEDGKATLSVGLPQLSVSTRPFEAQVIVRLADTNGRSVERTLTLPVEPSSAIIGVKPLFANDEVEEDSTARFDVIAVAPDGTRAASSGLTWRLERIESDYQWYRSNGNWNYELVTSALRVASGTVDATADQPATVSAPVKWGRYRFTVASADGDSAATSVEFYAGWYVSSASSDTPDVLAVALDKPAYRIGETAKLRLDPRFAGIALVSVIDDRLISMKAVEVPADGTTVDLAVTDQWGPGAYVTASLYRPMDIEAKRMPARALGLTWAKVDPGARDLDVSLAVVDEMRPRQAMTIPVAIGNLPAGTEAFVTVAAVDVGILNLTNFRPPAPDDWYFGQRKLGMDIRDLYGLLIDRMQGVPGVIRSGGDGGPARLAAPPPTEKLVAFYSGIVAVGPDGKASVSFDLPEFNGTVRVMAMAWSKTGVGHAVKDVLVRDPVVVTASLPQFLAAGDTSRLLVEVNNVAGPAGDYKLTVEADGIVMTPEDSSRTVPLKEKERVSFTMPISGPKVGDFSIQVSLASPSGEVWPKELALGVRPAGLPVTRRNLVALNGGGVLTVDKEPLSEFVPGTASVAVSIGGASRLDVAGILSALDRYPYGCAEQITSRAMPLVYLDDVAITVGIASDKAVKERVQTAIAGLMADQAANGSFGLWGPYDTGNLWLDSYVTDFLTRAAEKGYDVPKLTRDLALDNLANRVSYSEDFERGGEDIAYALYVLARAGRASLGDLRYYSETKIGSFSTALAKAQIGAALALYGDRQRAGNAFRAAFSDLALAKDNYSVWRGDYGTSLRDKAAVLTLAAETSIDAGDVRALAGAIAAEDQARKYTSTQENAWMLMAAAALIKDASRTSFEIEGASVAGPLYKRFMEERLDQSPVVIKNLGSETLDAVVATTGVPTAPEPAGGDGFTIERTYFTPDGEPTEIGTIGQNERIVVVLTVTADQAREGNILVVDPIPAGYEIENPNISTSGDVSAFDWLSVERNVAHTEARVDRFVAALNRGDDDPLEFSVAYSMRAVSPGRFAQPAATVEDMYRPGLQARTDTGTVEVVGPTR